MLGVPESFTSRRICEGVDVDVSCDAELCTKAKRLGCHVGFKGIVNSFDFVASNALRGVKDCPFLSPTPVAL